MTTNITAFMGKIDAINQANIFPTEKDVKMTQVINVNLEVVDRPSGLFNCVKVLLSRLVSILLWDIHSSKRAHNVATAVFAQMEQAETDDKATNKAAAFTHVQQQKVYTLLAKLDDKAHFTKNDDLATKVADLKQKIDKAQADQKSKAEKIKKQKDALAFNEKTLKSKQEEYATYWRSNDKMEQSIKGLQEQISKQKEELKKLEETN